MIDEAKLLLRLKQKQRASIDQAIEIYTPYLSTVLYNMLGNSLPQEDIEEIISDVFVALWKNAEYIDMTKGTLRSIYRCYGTKFCIEEVEQEKRLYMP